MTDEASWASECLDGGEYSGLAKELDSTLYPMLKGHVSAADSGVDVVPCAGSMLRAFKRGLDDQELAITPPCARTMLELRSGKCSGKSK